MNFFEMCPGCGRPLVGGEKGIFGLAFYDKPNGGVRILAYTLCSRCGFKIENSKTLRQKVVNSVEKRMIADGLLPWLA